MTPRQKMQQAAVTLKLVPGALDTVEQMIAQVEAKLRTGVDPQERVRILALLSGTTAAFVVKVKPTASTEDAVALATAAALVAAEAAGIPQQASPDDVAAALRDALAA
jgi:hypothetical protein